MPSIQMGGKWNLGTPEVHARLDSRGCDRIAFGDYARMKSFSNRLASAAVVVIALAFVSVVSGRAAQETTAIRGFLPSHAEDERQLEQKLQSDSRGRARRERSAPSYERAAHGGNRSEPSSGGMAARSVRRAMGSTRRSCRTASGCRSPAKCGSNSLRRIRKF